MTELMPMLSKLNAYMNTVATTPLGTGAWRDSLYHFAMFGMTQQLQVDMKAVTTMLIVGAVSAFGGAYLNAERMSVDIKNYATSQNEFRAEMRQYMRDDAIEKKSVNDRLTRQEIMLQAHVASAIDNAIMQRGSMDGMSGMQGHENGRTKK